MKNLFKKQIVDERMELQSLRNAQKSWSLILILLGISMLAKLCVLNWEIKYITFELVIVMVASIYNLYLDARDGNIYTAENSNRKKVFALYLAASVITGLFLGYHYYQMPEHSLLAAAVSFVLTTLLTCGGMLLLDRFCFKIGKKRIEKQDDPQDEE